MTRPVVLAAVPDLLFATRIRETAERVGVTIAGVRTVSDVGAARVERPGALLLVDLEASGDEDPLALIRRAAEGEAPLRVIAFGSHVDRERLAAAEVAGASRALPRSAFVTLLPAILAGEVGRGDRPGIA